MIVTLTVTLEIDMVFSGAWKGSEWYPMFSSRGGNIWRGLWATGGSQSYWVRFDILGVLIGLLAMITPSVAKGPEFPRD